MNIRSVGLAIVVMTGTLIPTGSAQAAYPIVCGDKVQGVITCNQIIQGDNTWVGGFDTEGAWVEGDSVPAQWCAWKFGSLTTQPISAYSMDGPALIGLEVATRSYTEFRNKKLASSWTTTTSTVNGQIMGSPPVIVMCRFGQEVFTFPV